MAEKKIEKPEQRVDLAAHKAALDKLKIRRVPEKKPLTPEQATKVRFQRLQMAAKRGTAQQRAAAIKLNAADLDLEPAVYQREFAHEITAAGC